MNKQTRPKIIIPDGYTKLFDIKVGILRDDTRVTFIFTIVLEYIMRKICNVRKEIEFQLKRI